MYIYIYIGSSIGVHILQRFVGPLEQTFYAIEGSFRKGERMSLLKEDG